MEVIFEGQSYEIDEEYRDIILIYLTNLQAESETKSMMAAVCIEPKPEQAEPDPSKRKNRISYRMIWGC
jgi:hypothetical protein